MIEAELVLQFLILLFDRPAVMGQPHERAKRVRRREGDKVRFDAEVVPRSRSSSNQTSGTSRRRRQSVAGMTRSAVKSAAHARFVPLRHETRRQARAGSCAAIARTASGRLPSVTCKRVRCCALGRLRRGIATDGVPRKTVSVDEIPSAYGSFHRCKVRRSRALSPRSASPSTAAM